MAKLVATIGHHLLTNLRPALCAVLLWLVLSGAASAQPGISATDGFTPDGLKAGAPAGSFQLSGFDNINYFNGNLNFTLPLLRVGGRGSAGVTIPLRIERKWRVIKTPSQPWVNAPEPNDWQSVDPGYGPGVLIGRRTGLISQYCNTSESSETDTLTRLTFTAGDGTEYELRDISALNGQQGVTYYSYCSVGLTHNRGKVFVSSDGTGVTFISNDDILDATSSPVAQIFPSGYLLMPDGGRYRIDDGRVTWIRDRNGNQITFQYGWGLSKITDSLNREVNIAYGDDPATPYNDHDEITYKGFGIATRTIKVWYSQMSAVMATDRAANPPAPYSILTYHDLFSEMNGSGSTPFNQERIVSAVELPDGRTYQFRYNSYGELARVELPTGGAVEYDYMAGLNGGPASGSYGGGGTYIDKQIYRRVTERRVYLDKNSAVFEHRTTISRPESIGGGGNLSYVDVENRSYSGAWLSGERHYYYGSARVPITQSPTDYTQWKTGREWKTEAFPSEGGAALRLVENTWQQPLDGYSWPLTAPETSDAARPNNAKLTQTLSTLTDTNQVAKQTFAYDQHFNQTDVYEYDYNVGAPAAYATRHAHTAYLTSNPVNGISYAAPAVGVYYTPNDYHLRNLPAQQLVYAVNPANGVETRAAQTEYEYDRYDGSAYHADLLGRTNISGMDSAYTATNSRPARGNVTMVKRYQNAAALSGEIKTHQQYDVAGNVLVAYDGRNNATTFEYDDRYGTPDGEAQANSAPTELASAGKTSYALPTRVSNALTQTSYTQFNYYLGRPVDMQDSNGVVASASYNDALDRPTQVIRANTQGQADANRSQTGFAYDPANRLITTTSDQLSYGDQRLKSELVYDGLGRTTETRSYETASAYTSVAQQYDALGRPVQVSNPYRAGDTLQWTTTSYDGLGRVVAVTSPGGATVSTAYDGARVLVTDQASQRRISETDALGRLRNVWEITGADGATETISFPGSSVTAGYRTKYAYDALDDLTTVTQQVGTSGTLQTRSFVYDSLKRLTSATNPESGQTSYVYDEQGNLRFKTDARPITTEISYDALNRPISKSYTGGITPTVNYHYDGQLPNGAPSFDPGKATGRLVAVTYASGSQGNYYGYDTLGRAARSYQQTAGQNYAFLYQYNLAGSLTAQTYPSGRVVTTGYDSAGRISEVKLLGASWSYAANFSYAAHGAVKQMQLGNGLWEQMVYNTRLQVEQIGLGTASGNMSKLQLVYGYGATATNNGNVLSQTINIAATSDHPALGVTQSYSYDALNRLATASEGGWAQNYAYDRYGNRRITSATGGVNNYNPTYELTNNRITTLGYDPAGNVTYDPATNRTMTYDAENRLLTANNGGGSYSYDGEGRRVQKVVGGVTTVFVYNAQGQLIAEYTSSGPAAGIGGTKYVTADTLGSTRLVTSGGSGTVKARYDYLPFGEELGTGIGGRTAEMKYSVADTTRQKFVGYERDSETGLDYAQARYYTNVQGRFTSIDKVFFQKDMVIDPQRFNLYAYVRNNPLRFLDPSGDDIELIGSVDDRKQLFKALQEGAGEAGKQLIIDTRTDKDGNQRYFVEIKGDAAEFAKLNEVAGELAPIIADTKVASLQFAEDNSTITNAQGDLLKFSAAGKGGGVLGYADKVSNDLVKIHIARPKPGSGYEDILVFRMRSGRPGSRDLATIGYHELGHARAFMTGDVGPVSRGDAISLALGLGGRYREDDAALRLSR